jgi:L-2-amino-thiazoline-4-carboxylic acid hydrolase
LVPLIKALQAELGEERANALVGKTLGDVYRRLGEQWWRVKKSSHVGEILLVCDLDFPFAEGFGPDIKLTRTQTIMQGASHCDFRYWRQKD